MFGFNGAAGVNPRMAGSAHAPGNPSPGFNGAAGVNPRMALWCATTWQSRFGFNGAAGVNPRMERAVRSDLLLTG